jgi:hypothetical protein
MTSSMLNICVPFIYIAFSIHLKPLYDPQRETKKEKSPGYFDRSTQVDLWGSIQISRKISLST